MKKRSEDYKTTKDMLVERPLPAQTRTYKPVSHAQVIDLTLEGIHKAGFQLEKSIYSAAKDGDVANGRYLIKSVEDSEMQLQFSWQNSYDKSKVLSFAAGANVLVCTNGMFAFRDMNSFRRKHVGEIQTFAPNAISEYIKRSGEMFGVLQKDRDEMKQIEVNQRLVAELLGRMYFEERFLESTQLNIIKKELSNPTHDYNSKGSLWELYQFTTFAIGGIHPSKWMEDHLAAHDFFSNVMEEVKGYKVEDAEFEIEDKRQLKLFDA